MPVHRVKNSDLEQAVAGFEEADESIVGFASADGGFVVITSGKKSRGAAKGVEKR